MPPESLLAMLDVSSLYANIPHDEGFNACEEFLSTRTDQSPSTKDLCQLIQLILESNTFTFNGACYLQLQGTAMGTRMAPSYANLFMGKFEQEFLQTQNRLPLVWWRYIDDVFAIWTHGVPCLNAFLRELNNYHTTIKFTADWSSKEVTFLDTRVTLKMGKWRRICTSNLLADINIYILKVATPNIVRLLYRTVKPSGLKEFARKGRTPH